MASENLELVQSLFATWERGDFSAVEWADREIVFTVADFRAGGLACPTADAASTTTGLWHCHEERARRRENRAPSNLRQ